MWKDAEVDGTCEPRAGSPVPDRMVKAFELEYDSFSSGILFRLAKETRQNEADIRSEVFGPFADPVDADHWPGRPNWVSGWPRKQGGTRPIYGRRFLVPLRILWMWIIGRVAQTGYRRSSRLGKMKGWDEIGKSRPSEKRQHRFILLRSCPDSRRHCAATPVTVHSAQGQPFLGDMIWAKWVFLHDTVKELQHRGHRKRTIRAASSKLSHPRIFISLLPIMAFASSTRVPVRRKVCKSKGPIRNIVRTNMIMQRDRELKMDPWLTRETTVRETSNSSIQTDVVEVGLCSPDIPLVFLGPVALIEDLLLSKGSVIVKVHFAIHAQDCSTEEAKRQCVKERGGSDGQRRQTDVLINTKDTEQNDYAEAVENKTHHYRLSSRSEPVKLAFPSKTITKDAQRLKPGRM
ncbi:hypothetical protein T265_03242 [Opisthorchis viverrini]|uniref:Uncharacterized protein n=1 Tax=Opisthorchis viverrini TaxID=6198 RepID=A0A074ZS91_OPIVI|nr:hypothetical protein T265_03242 [Opisthorchis viverrini]KER30293.1 hypothetical protein T265_03242 [Opisthorchis viverrini]